MTKKKGKWAWLGAIAAILGAAGGGAVDAVMEIATTGAVDPASIQKAAIVGAVIGTAAYFKRSPAQKDEQESGEEAAE